MKFWRILGAACLTAVLWGNGAARAQEAPDIALNQYQPPFAGDDFMSVPRPAIGGHLVPRGMLTFDYSKDPLVLVDQNGDVVATPVTSQVFLHFGASLALFDRLMIDLSFPLAVAQGGDTQSVGAVTFPAAEGAAPGDLRAGLRGRIFGEYRDPFQLSAGGYVWFPTGGKDSYTGEGTVYGEPHLLLGGRLPYFVYSASAGAIVRGSDNPHTFTYRAGAGVLLVDDMLLIGPEVFGSVNLEDRSFFETTSSPIERKGAVAMEVLGTVQYRFIEDFVVGAGAGAGITDGVGAPQVRVLGRFSYAPEPEEEKEVQAPADRDGDGIVDPDDACPDTPGVRSDDPEKNGCPPDRDGDGIVDDEDACPDTPGPPHDDPAKNGCPPPGDRDGDEIVDEEDACPDTPGVANDDPEKNGCPPDRDGDGIVDDEDACPDTPGVESDDPSKNGCPPDRDGDGIVDEEDACPDEPGIEREDPEKNGCPRVVVTDEEIVILQKVEFDFDKATIKPASDSLLDEVAETLKNNPELERVEVQGHTDNKGSPVYNRQLSQRRADAVKQALVDRGVEEGRLVTKGYGQSEPIASNDTEEGRAKNRRVQFKIVERKE